MVAIGFLDDGQVGSLAVLDQHQLALFPFVQLGHDRRNPFQSRQFRGLQPPMADDQREPSLRRGHDQQVLSDALGADGIGQLAHIAHVAAGIRRIRVVVQSAQSGSIPCSQAVTTRAASVHSSSASRALSPHSAARPTWPADHDR